MMRTSPLVADALGCVWAAAVDENRKVLLGLICGCSLAKHAQFQADKSVDTVLQEELSQVPVN